MEKVVLIRYGEIHLKGKNRWMFEKQLVDNIKDCLHDITCEVSKIAGRFLVSGYNEIKENIILDRLVKIGGIHSISPCIKIATSIDNIKDCAKIFALDADGSFRVETNRADKTFPYPSPEFSALIGGFILDENPSLKVKLKNADSIFNIDIREDGFTYIYSQDILGLGGMPVGSSGRGMLLLSGGIDSPVAGIEACKRGVKLCALHFVSPPYTNAQAKEKVIDLAKKIKEFNGRIRLFTISTTKIQETLHNRCAEELGITLLRRFMYRIAERICENRKVSMIITGESLGQVASQTIESITTIESAKQTHIPVIRPLICFDKEQTIVLAKKYNTFDISIQPFQDCCTVFLPANPATKPSIKRCEKEEKRIDVEALISEALANIEEIII